MQDRQLLFRLVSLLLYFGPLVAGLSGHGWSVLPAFVAIFLVWQAFLQPATWPRDADGWRQPGAVTGALTRLALVVLLVALCIAIGRGIGGAAGYLPGVPVAAPLALSFLSVPLARLVWQPGDAPTPAEPARRAGDDPLHDTIRPLLDLPEDTQDGTAQAAIARLGDSPMADALLASLTDALVGSGAPATAARRGLILWATEPVLAAQFRGRVPLSNAWAVAHGRPALQQLYARRAAALLAVQTDARADLPTSAQLREAARQGTQAAPDLGALADALDHAVRPGR